LDFKLLINFSFRDIIEVFLVLIHASIDLIKVPLLSPGLVLVCSLSLHLLENIKSISIKVLPSFVLPHVGFQLIQAGQLNLVSFLVHHLPPGLIFLFRPLVAAFSIL
jgi:hypothetical protein